MAISRSIVDAVRSMTPPGRFLDKDPETGLWNDIGDRKAIEKTSQALRDGAADLRKQLSQDLGDPDFLNAVFEDDMDISERTATTISSDGSHKEKEKPVKVKENVKQKGHRRTRSNPNTLAEKKKAVASKKRKPVELAEEMERSAPHHSSPNRATFGRAASFDYAYPYHVPHTPPSHPGAHYPPPPLPPTTTSSPSLKSASFDSGTPAQRSHSWNHHPPHPHHPHSGHRPPLSPSSLPGRHPLSPPPTYSHAHMSPLHRSWSPGAYAGASPPFRSWRTSPSPYAYPHGDLQVPTLGRETSDSSAPRVPLSPVRRTSPGQENVLYHPPAILRAGSAEDFVPPPSPGGWAKRKEEKIIIAKPIRERDERKVDEAEEDEDMLHSTSAACSLFSCFMLDTEEEKTGIEVVLSASEDTDAADPADDHGNPKAISPLPFLRKEAETPTSFFDTLLTLPIAPCAPQDVE